MLSQIKIPIWPSGDSKPIFDLTISKVEIEKRFCIVFEALEDDLGPFWAAAVNIDDFGSLVFWKYEAGPNQSCAVHVDMGKNTDDAIKFLIKKLGILETEIGWRRPSNL